MTIGFHSPMPPAQTGVADYSEALVRALRPYATIRVNPPPEVRVDGALYQVGNNPLHRAAYGRALAAPGVVVLHDAVLQHFHLGQGTEEDYVSEFVYNYGEWNRGLGHDLWRGRARSGQDAIYFRYPMLRRIVEASRAVVVHNPAAAASVRAHGSVRVEELPHLFEPPPPVDPVAVIERRSGWGRFVFGIFGHLRESKRVMAVLRAFALLRTRFDDVSLLVAGNFVSDDLARAAAPLLAAPGVIRVPYLPEEDFWTCAHAVDACINLRFPSAAETSGIAIRLMGIGKPVIVTEGEETSRFPETACLRVSPGTAEPEMLLASMLLLATDGGTARRIGAAAAAHIRRHHDPDSVARRMLALLS